MRLIIINIQKLQIHKTNEEGEMNMVVLIFIILIVGGIIYYKKTAGSDNAKLVKELTRGRNQTQTDVITYLVRQGCGAKTITDQQYLDIVSKARAQYNSMQHALDKIGIDEDEVREVKPVYFEGFRYGDAYTKTVAGGTKISSSYEITWIFFSDSQVHVYECTFNLDDDRKTEIVDEYFYKDITSFTTVSIEEKDRDGNVYPVEVFRMKGAGDINFQCTMTDKDGAAASIRGMKQKLREKKNA